MQRAIKVKHTEKDGIIISTVLSAGLSGCIYETMVFGGEFDNHQHRTLTEEEALSEHDRLVRKIFPEE